MAENNTISILEKIGLSPTEAKIYLALLDLGEANVRATADHTKINRRNVYDALIRLLDKGIIFAIVGLEEKVYCPVDPDKLAELVQEKKMRLAKILPDFNAQYAAKRGPQEAFIYRGVNGFKQYMRDILRTGENGYFIGAKLGWFDPRIRVFTEQFLQQAKRKKIQFYHLFDARVKDQPELYKNFSPKRYKFLPEQYSTNSIVDICGDHIVNFNVRGLRQLDDLITLFVLRDGSLAESYRQWFKFMFEICPNV